MIKYYFKSRINKKLASEQGFTFVEIVMAISILAIMMVTTQGILIQIMRGTKTLNEVRDADLILNNVTNRLNRELSLAQNESLPLETECNSNTVTDGYKIFICGETNENKEFRHDSISFMSRKAKQYLRGKYISKSKQISDLVYIKYRVEKAQRERGEKIGDDKYWLIRDEIPVVNKELQKDYRMTFPVIKGITELKFRYYDKDEEKWQDVWDKRNNLPSLIEFTIKIPGSNNQGKIYQHTSMVSF